MFINRLPPTREGLDVQSLTPTINLCVIGKGE